MASNDSREMTEEQSLEIVNATHGEWMDAIVARTEAEAAERTAKARHKRERAAHEAVFGEIE